MLKFKIRGYTMKGNRLRILMILFICTALFLAILTACGNNNGIDESYSNCTTDPQVYTLTMSAPAFFAPLLREAERYLNRSMNQESGNSFRLELTTYGNHITATQAEWELHRQRFNMLLMSGEPFDLFVVDRHPLWHYARGGLLADIYELIDQDPNVSRDDFFTNALGGFEYQGQLLSIPPMFGITFVGINSTLPQDFIDRFSQYEMISYMSLLNIYRDLKLAHPGEFDHLVYASLGVLRPYVLLEYAVSDFIDSGASIARLTDAGFIDFLEVLHFALGSFTNRNDYVPSFMRSRNFIEIQGHRFVFSTVDGGFCTWEALFELDSSPFVNYIPITNSSGRIMTYSRVGVQNQFLSLAVSNGVNQYLAWEFIRSLIRVSSYQEIRTNEMRAALNYMVAPNTINTSIMTEGFAVQAQRAFEQVFYRDSINGLGLISFIRHDEPDALQRQISNAIVRLEGYVNMPVAHRPYIPAAIWPIYDDFMDGIITADDAAHRLQNIISLWLIE